MIARIWHGWTKPEDAKTYEKLLRAEIFPSIAARKIEGYRGAELFVRDASDEVEFITLLRFDSMEAVTEFAGPDTTKPVIFQKPKRSSHEWSMLGIITWRSTMNCRAGAPPASLSPGKRRACPTTDVRDVARNGSRFEASRNPR